MKNYFLKILLSVWITVGLSLLPAFADGGMPQEVLVPLEELVIKTKSGSFKFRVEIADEVEERSMGLMFRENMPSNQGMLFDFGKIETVAMWMKNTPLSLDMVFIRPDGVVHRIARDTKPFSTDVISSRGPVSHVLEVNAGIGLLIGLEVGDLVEHRFFRSEN